MKKVLAFCIGLMALLISSAWIAKEDPFLALIKKLEEFAKLYPTENVHLHLDKPYYAIGDDIWFKAYVTDSKTAAPTTISNVLYVELIDETDSLKKQLILPMQSGISWGDFKLADTLLEGNYRIRAYTQWMRNAGPDFFFEKTIKIGNSWANKVFVKAENLLSKEGNNEKVNSTIRFTDKNEQPYTNVEVTYSAELGEKIVTKGKTETNSNGEINIPIVNTQANTNQSGKITATLTLPDKQKVTKIIPIKTTSTAIDVQFFPESGNLIQDLPNRIAFKAINAQGKGEDIKGSVFDNDGEEITTFESSHLGMGSFSLHPMAGKTYRAKVNGRFFDLPKPQSSGYILSVNSSDTNNVLVKVLLSDDLIGKGDLQLLAQQNGNISFSVKISTAKNFTSANLPKSDFPSGISTLTLFNAAALPVAERLVFVNNAFDKIKIDVENLKEQYRKRELINLNLIGLNENTLVEGSFSVAVTNTSAVEPDPENETNIFTSLLLKSELKGYIEKPNAYFMADDVKTRANLDHLLLTQGWRKIDWKTINSSTVTLNRFMPETGLQISGTVNTLAGKPLANGKVSLFTSSIGILTKNTLTDANGKFSFKDLEFPDSAKFVITALNEKGKSTVGLKLDVPSKQRIAAQKNVGDIEINVNEKLRNYLSKSDGYFDEQTKKGMLSHTIQLKKVEITGQKKKVETSSNLNGAGRADLIITKKDLKNSARLSDLVGSKNRNFMNRFNGESSAWPTIVVDGMYFLPDRKLPPHTLPLDVINPWDIETVEILTSPNTTAIYGIRGMNGVIVITTRKGGYEPDEDEIKNTLTYTPKGYTIPRQFYSPRYDTKADPKPDLRTTIYWNPSILSDKEGKFKLDYFNADSPGIYRVVIEGIDFMGNLARKTFTYQVN